MIVKPSQSVFFHGHFKAEVAPFTLENKIVEKLKEIFGSLNELNDFYSFIILLGMLLKKKVVILNRCLDTK